MDRPGVRQVPEGSGEQRNMEETGCEVICRAPTTPAAKGWLKVKVKVKSHYTHMTLTTTNSSLKHPKKIVSLQSVSKETKFFRVKRRG